MTARRPVSRRERIALGAVGVVLLLLAWELLVRAGILPGRFLPPPTEVVAALGPVAADPGTWRAAGRTLATWAGGLGIASALALALGLVLGMSAGARRWTATTVEMLRPIPSVALIPLAVLVFGVGAAPVIALVVYAAFWQLLVPIVRGARDEDPIARDTVRAFRLRGTLRVTRVVLPGLAPYAATGMRLAASTALVLAITGELVIGSAGLGQQIFLAQSAGAVAQMHARIAIVGLIGVAIDLTLRAVERRALFWHGAARGEKVA